MDAPEVFGSTLTQGRPLQPLLEQSETRFRTVFGQRATFQMIEIRIRAGRPHEIPPRGIATQEHEQSQDAHFQRESHHR